MQWLLPLAIVLVVLWIVAEALGWVVGAALNLLWIAALVFFGMWLFQRFRTRP